jgi:glycosyltransferase involved in cell wall biosynthesis
VLYKNIIKKMNPRISIITITHQGREKYIPELLQSIRNQSFQNWELIVIDNGSYDNTQNLITKETANDSRISYIKNEQDRGISFARNQALQKAKSDYIAVLDSDDLWADKEKLTQQIAYLDTYQDCVAVGTGVIVIDEQSQELSRYQNETDAKKIKQELLFKNQIAHSSVMYKKAAALHVGGYDANLPFLEDYDLWLKMGAIWKLANLEGFMTKYRKHQTNITKKELIRMLKMNIRLVVKYKKDYPNFFRAIFKRVATYLIKLLISITNRN